MLFFRLVSFHLMIEKIQRWKKNENLMILFFYYSWRYMECEKFFDLIMRIFFLMRLSLTVHSQLYNQQWMMILDDEIFFFHFIFAIHHRIVDSKRILLIFRFSILLFCLFFIRKNLINRWFLVYFFEIWNWIITKTQWKLVFLFSS